MKSSGLPIPSELTPDALNVEVDIGPAVIMAYGTVVKCVLALKVGNAQLRKSGTPKTKQKRTIRCYVKMYFKQSSLLIITRPGRK